MPPYKCETPKSPPGDYNLCPPGKINTYPSCGSCETPKSPPGDYNRLSLPEVVTLDIPDSVKHLNPRQGITTRALRGRIECGSRQCETPKSPPGDYNKKIVCVPRAFSSSQTCETPKSPPGDYNKNGDGRAGRNINVSCETPKSPPGDYNREAVAAGLDPATALV